ncbi:GNAT family N-acetyltransferase [Paenibacillus sp. GCM10027628]|uniref:GNAT family N-acetyltransferase n=1 Tax=Paenibacillus sp. GCM10027628 TaxID=3273413 RepID=UPI00363F1BF0
MEVRCLQETDYTEIISVLNDWWGGRQMTQLLPRLFFEHFQNTSFVIEHDGKIVSFLVGFISQTHSHEAYIHFVGVHPEFRKNGLARRLYKLFFNKVRGHGCNTVRCITSPVNKNSILFHQRMGFSSSIAVDYESPGEDRVLFVKDLTDLRD